MTEFSDLTPAAQKLAWKLQILPKEVRDKIGKAIDLYQAGQDDEAHAVLEAEKARIDRQGREAR